MRCPKCHYLSFEPERKCRNCEYDFSLAETELSLQPPAESGGPFADLDLRLKPPLMSSTPSHNPRHAPVGPANGPLAIAVAERPDDPAGDALEPRVALRPATTELPLFVRGLPAGEPGPERDLDRPLVSPPAAPRPPLAVRRRAPEAPPPASPLPPAPRPRPPVMAQGASALGAAKSGGAEHGRLLDVPAPDAVWTPLAADAPERAHAAAFAAASRTRRTTRVTPGARVTAALVDVALLGGIDLMIVWFTLRICALTFGQALTLPVLPLAAFCILLDVGYLLLFTASGGQTLGKMAAGIRVVAEDSEAGAVALTGRQALMRAILTVPSVLAAGIGWLPALVGKGPAVHDRLSHTRVIRS